jgi:transcriptional regulator with XRE-family HTH domain
LSRRTAYVSGWMPLLEEVLTHIGANLRARRQKLELTQERVAELANLDLRFVQRVERGQTNLSVAVLVALAEVLGCAPAAFFKPAILPAARLGRPRKRPATRSSR